MACSRVNFNFTFLHERHVKYISYSHVSDSKDAKTFPVRSRPTAARSCTKQQSDYSPALNHRFHYEACIEVTFALIYTVQQPTAHEITSVVSNY